MLVLLKISHALESETRTGRFFQTLGGSYLLIGAATLYSFLTIPMVLRFAGTEMLGIWLLVSQITTYLTAIDAGLSSASIRQFVGPVTASDPARLAPRFQATLAISIFQGLLICLAGCFTPEYLARALDIPSSHRQDFIALFTAQSVLVGLAFPLRPFSSILLAAQRFGPNYLSSGVFLLLAVGTGWFGFMNGWGIWGLFVGNILVGLGQFFFAVQGVVRMRFFSALFSKWSIDWGELGNIFREGLAFASGPFFGALAGFLQSAVLSRLFGLEGVALWNVGFKIASVLAQILSKFFESSFGGLSELAEKGLIAQMISRFTTIFFVTSSISFLLGAALIFLNEAFIRWWTGGILNWPLQATAGIAFWLVASTANKGMAEQMKILLLWRQIRWGPPLDLAAVAFLFSFLWLAPSSLPLFSLTVAISPLLGAFPWYCNSLYPQLIQSVKANPERRVFLFFLFFSSAIFGAALLFGLKS